MRVATPALGALSLLCAPGARPAAAQHRASGARATYIDTCYALRASPWSPPPPRADSAALRLPRLLRLVDAPPPAEIARGRPYPIGLVLGGDVEADSVWTSRHPERGETRWELTQGDVVHVELSTLPARIILLLRPHGDTLRGYADALPPSVRAGGPGGAFSAVVVAVRAPCRVRVQRRRGSRPAG